jgi:phage terminase large subunit
VLHRRAGKTTAIINHHIRAAMDDHWEMARLRYLLPDAREDHLRPLLKRRIYWHVMPTLKQAKEVAWDMLKEFSRPIPGHKANNSELTVTYPNGNKVKLIGADDPDSLRGPALSGLSLDEYSQIDPRTFGEVLSKALGDHVGYCIFSGTIKGKDQLYQTYQAAKDDADWYAVWQDIDVSLSTEVGPTITALRRAMEDDLKLVRQGVMTQAEYDQEWYLSLDAAIKGAFYAAEMAAAKKAGRITRVPYDPMLPVDTDWDLGIDDLLTIWFSQSLRSGEVRLIDYYETADKGIPQVIAEIKEKPYAYGTHWGPHDIAVRELGTGKSRSEVAASHGVRFQMTPRLLNAEAGMEVAEGIRAVRMLFSRCWFDEVKCARGIEALRHYRSVFNKQLGQFTGVPVHDWASHGADAFRYLAVRQQVPVEKRRVQSAPMPTGGWH